MVLNGLPPPTFPFPLICIPFASPLLSFLLTEMLKPYRCLPPGMWCLKSSGGVRPRHLSVNVGLLVLGWHVEMSAALILVDLLRPLSCSLCGFDKWLAFTRFLLFGLWVLIFVCLCEASVHSPVGLLSASEASPLVLTGEMGGFEEFSSVIRALSSLLYLCVLGIHHPSLFLDPYDRRSLFLFDCRFSITSYQSGADLS